jgi:hypothetical protein
MFVPGLTAVVKDDQDPEAYGPWRLALAGAVEALNETLPEVVPLAENSAQLHLPGKLGTQLRPSHRQRPAGSKETHRATLGAEPDLSGADVDVEGHFLVNFLLGIAGRHDFSPTGNFHDLGPEGDS